MAQLAECPSATEPVIRSLGLHCGLLAEMTQWEVSFPAPWSGGDPQLSLRGRGDWPASRAMRRQAADPAAIRHTLLPSTEEDGVDQEEEDGGL